MYIKDNESIIFMFPKSCSKQARSPRIIKNIVIDVMRYDFYINTYRINYRMMLAI